VFLFTGWSIAAACLSMVITAALWWGTSATVFGALIIVLFAQAGLLWVPLPIRVIGHVYQAVEYAMARRRNTHSALRQNLAGLIAAAYVVGHAVNLLT
jgi:hypothetical protein